MSIHVFETTIGGVMTKEVGAITGDVAISTRVVGGKQVVEIAYLGAQDTYTVQGSPIAPAIGLVRIVEHLTTDPGVDFDGNAAVVSIEDLTG